MAKEFDYLAVLGKIRRGIIRSEKKKEQKIEAGSVKELARLPEYGRDGWPLNRNLPGWRSIVEGYGIKWDGLVAERFAASSKQTKKAECYDWRATAIFSCRQEILPTE